jgi:(p)ppGpp synthase/HD superfamily hydrolase
MKIHAYAQTEIQLFNQLINDGYSNTELVCIHNAYKLSVSLFAGRFQSSGKDFIAHVVGTASILGSLHLPAEVIAAGLIHSVYRIGDFGHGGMDISSTKRNHIKHALGDEVEDYVYRFNRFQDSRWNPSTIQAICNDVKALGPVERNTILLHLADLLERHLDLEALYGENIERQRLIEYTSRNGHLMVDIAERLGFPTLAADLKEAFKETALAEIPVEFHNKSVRSYSFVIPPKSYKKRLSVTLYQKLEHQAHSLRRQLVSALSRVRRRIKRLCLAIGLGK